jgi:hypothetical protein
MRFRSAWIISAALLSACSLKQTAPQARWTDLRMGMSYAEVVRIVGPPQHRLQPGERLDGVIIPGPDLDVYVWRIGDVTKSASFSDDHLNGVTGQLD